MEITQEQQRHLAQLLQDNINMLNALLEPQEQLTAEQLASAIADVLKLENLAPDYIQQVTEMVNSNYGMTIKEFKSLLHRVCYQQQLGNVRNIKGYLLSTIAKETKQSVYK